MTSQIDMLHDAKVFNLAKFEAKVVATTIPFTFLNNFTKLSKN